MLQLKLSAIKQIEAFARSNNSIISLSQGFIKIRGLNSIIKQNIQSLFFSSEIDCYTSPTGIMELRTSLRHYLEKRHKISLKTDNIMITAGCSGALMVIAHMLLNKGDQVILPTPTYPSYENVIRLTQAEPLFISFPPHQKMFINTLQKHISPQTKMIILSNPTNPTGEILDKSVLEDLILFCENHSIYLIIDEVYEDYIFEGSYQSSLPYISSSPHLIRVSSFSKNFAMSGWRIGYIVFSETLFEKAHIIQDSIFIAPPTISQYAALEALKHPEIIHSYHSYLKENRELTFNTLIPFYRKNILEFKKPNASFYFFIKTKEPDTTALCLDIIKKVGVSLVPGKAFGFNCGSYIRLCFARDKEVLEEGLNRLASYWSYYV